MNRPFNGTFRLLAVLFLVSARLVRAAEPFHPAFLEKKRVITKTFSVSPKDRLFVSNQFGEVRVSLWDKAEVRADILITAYGATDDEAQALLETVEIDDERQGDQIRLVTQCGSSASKTNWAWAWSDRRSKKPESASGAPAEQRGVRIQYALYLPRYTALELKARFSNSFIPEFSAPLVVRCNYGNVTAGRLSGLHNDIRVSYGEAIIKALEKGKLAIEYSKLMLDKADDLELDNKFGNMRIGEVDKLVAELSYTSGRIDAFNQSVRMQLRFLHNFRLPPLPPGMKTMEINSEGSDVRLPVPANANMDFDVTVNYADFRAPGERFVYTRKDEGDDPRGKPQIRRTYVGKVGKGGGTVKITSTYGTVKFEE